MKEFNHRLTIQAPAAAVLDVFFDPDALTAWWRVKRSLCLPRPLGVYAVEWEPTEWQDDVFGPLGGAFRGTVIEFKPGREFFLADLFWLPPDGEPVGPMALEATCTQTGNAQPSMSANPAGKTARAGRATTSSSQPASRWLSMR